MKKITGVVCGFLVLLSACARQAPSTATLPEGPAGIQERDPQTLYSQAKQSYALGRNTLALALLQRFVSLHPKHELYPKVQSLLLSIQERLGEGKIKIGLILPLTGQTAPFGDSVWLGVSCALGLFDPCTGEGERYQLVLRDAEDSPASVEAAVMELAQSEKVALIIGPLLSANAEAAAQAAQSLGVPLISLAPKEGLAKAGPYVFQYSLTALAEIAALNRYVAQSGFQKVAILYPKNRYGEQYRALFEEMLESRGSRPAAVAGFEPNTDDFMPVLRKLKSDFSSNRLYEETEALFDAVFIPDNYRSASLIAQSWQFAGLGPAIFLGTSRWNHPNLLAENPESLEGAVFVAGFYPESKREVTEQFVSNFNRAFGHQPGWLEAAGFDALRISVEAIGMKGNDHWPDVQRSLSGLEDFPVAIGDLSWSGNRTSDWELTLLTVKETALQPLENNSHE